MKEGKPGKFDSEYKQNGVASVFLAFEPLTGKRQVRVPKAFMIFADFTNGK